MAMSPMSSRSSASWRGSRRRGEGSREAGGRERPRRPRPRSHAKTARSKGEGAPAHDDRRRRERGTSVKTAHKFAARRRDGDDDRRIKVGLLSGYAYRSRTGKERETTCAHSSADSLSRRKSSVATTPDGLSSSEPTANGSPSTPSSDQNGTTARDLDAALRAHRRLTGPPSRYRRLPQTNACRSSRSASNPFPEKRPRTNGSVCVFPSCKAGWRICPPFSSSAYVYFPFNEERFSRVQGRHQQLIDAVGVFRRQARAPHPPPFDEPVKDGGGRRARRRNPRGSPSTKATTMRSEPRQQDLGAGKSRCPGVVGVHTPGDARLLEEAT